MLPTSHNYRALGEAAATTESQPGPTGWSPPAAEEFAAALAQSHPQYQVNRFIAAGGMGAVYQGRDSRIGQDTRDCIQLHLFLIYHSSREVRKLA